MRRVLAVTHRLVRMGAAIQMTSSHQVFLSNLPKHTLPDRETCINVYLYLHNSYDTQTETTVFQDIYRFFSSPTDIIHMKTDKVEGLTRWQTARTLGSHKTIVALGLNDQDHMPADIKMDYSRIYHAWIKAVGLFLLLFRTCTHTHAHNSIFFCFFFQKMQSWYNVSTHTHTHTCSPCSCLTPRILDSADVCLFLSMGVELFFFLLSFLQTGSHSLHPPTPPTRCLTQKEWQ